MNHSRAVFSLVAVLCLGLVAATAQVAAQEYDVGPAVVPQAERDLAASKKMSGPTKNKGVKSVTPRASVALDGEFASGKGRILRAREIVVEPGGIVAVHEHNQRPGIAYILEGEIYEHRDGVAKPVLHRNGDVAMEKTGVTHWWENKSAKPARALVVDIVPADLK